MYVRLTTLHGHKGNIEAGVDYVEGTARAAIEAAAGNRGFATFTDAAAGVVMGASYWEGERSRAESGTALADLRAGLGKAGGGDVTFENYVAAVARRVAIPQPGAVVRLLRVHLDPAQLGELVELYRDEIVARLTAPSGVCSAQLLVDPDTGRGLGVTAWTDEAALANARPVLEEAGRVVQGRVSSLRFAGTELYSLVCSTVALG